MSYDPGRCFWCENMQCDNCNGINEWRNPHASESIGQPCKCSGHHPYKLRPKRFYANAPVSSIVTDPLMGIYGEIVQERTKALEVSARDLLGADPDFTGGLSVDEYMDEQRGRGQE